MMKRIVLVVGILLLFIEACIIAPAPTPAPTATLVITQTKLPTGTPTPTKLPTDTPIPTELPTNTSAPTDLPTNTPIPIKLPTNTPTRTKLPTDTPTQTATSTWTPTETPTSSPTPTWTPTSTPTRTPTPTSTPPMWPTSSCQYATHKTVLSVSTESMKVGETLKVKATLSNDGCAYVLGLPKYYLYIQTNSLESIFTPDNPAPVTHYLGIHPGESDTVEFDLKAISSGQATLWVRVSMEVHLGYPGPAYWGGDSSQEIIVTVEPLDSPTLTVTPTPTDTSTPTITATRTSTPTPMPYQCTPPACSGGVLACGNPNGCPGGCGTICINPTRTPTRIPCTPPACSGGVLTCGNPNGCPGGCGTICLTATPTP